MKKIELIYQEMLYNALEKKNRRLTQSALSKGLGVSLSTVSHALKPLKKMDAVEIRNRLFIITDPKKLLYHWASIRNLERDIVYQTRVEKSVLQIEKELPPNAIYAAYSAYRHRFGEAPADYSEVYVYGEKEELEKRFPKNDRQPNLFVLKKERVMERYGQITTAGLTFVDLWNIRSWYAKEFLKSFEARLHGILE